MLLVVDSALNWFGISLCPSYAFGFAYSYNDIFRCVVFFKELSTETMVHGRRTILTH